MAGKDDNNLFLFSFTIKAEVYLETSGYNTYLVHSDSETFAALAEFIDTSDLTNFNKDEDIKVADL